MFLKYYKPQNVFSNQKVRQIGKQLGTKKVGHTGTLDPLASGLMIIASHEDTRMLEYITHTTKTYIAQAQFFYQSASLDNYNCTPEATPKVEFSKDQLLQAINKIKQTNQQIPPQISAKKINGKRAYDLSRDSIKFELKPQKIKIRHLQLLDFDNQNWTFKIKLTISAGGYVRSVLRDIACELNTTCVMTSLKRTQIGNLTLDGLSEDTYEEIDFTKLIDLQRLELNDKWIKALKNGNAFECKQPNGKYLIVKENLIVSVGEINNHLYQPHKVFIERI